MRRKATIIEINESSFSGYGATSNVILRGLKDEGVTLFSKVYGEYNDTKITVGLNLTTASHMEKISHDDTLLTPCIFTPVVDIDEYEFSNAIQNELGVVEDGRDYIIVHPENVKYTIYMHDDYFFSVNPINSRLVKELVQSILQDHTSSNIREVDLSEVIDGFLILLSKFNKIRICSCPKWNYLTIRKVTSFWGLINGFREWLFPRSFCAINIDDGKATFTKAFFKKLDDYK
jgi:hypothetical protein